MIAVKVVYIQRQNKMKSEIEAGAEDKRRVTTGDRNAGFKYHI